MVEVINGSGSTGTYHNMLQVLLVLRVIRVFKLFPALDQLMNITWRILPAMLNILALMFLTFFMMAVLGTFLFNQVGPGNALDDNFVNFRNFGNSFLMMFRMSTGEDWHIIMYDCIKQDLYLSLYFIMFIIFV